MIPGSTRCIAHAAIPALRLNGSCEASSLATIPCSGSRPSHPNADSKPARVSGEASASAKSLSNLGSALSSIALTAAVKTAPADGASSDASQKLHACSPATDRPSRCAASLSSTRRRSRSLTCGAEVRRARPSQSPAASSTCCLITLGRIATRPGSLVDRGTRPS